MSRAQQQKSKVSGRAAAQERDGVIRTTTYIPIELNRRLLHYKADHMATTYGRNDVLMEALDFFLTKRGYPAGE